MNFFLRCATIGIYYSIKRFPGRSLNFAGNVESSSQPMIYYLCLNDSRYLTGLKSGPAEHSWPFPPRASRINLRRIAARARTRFARERGVPRACNRPYYFTVGAYSLYALYMAACYVYRPIWWRAASSSAICSRPRRQLRPRRYALIRETSSFRINSSFKWNSNRTSLKYLSLAPFRASAERTWFRIIRRSETFLRRVFSSSSQCLSRMKFAEIVRSTGDNRIVRTSFRQESDIENTVETRTWVKFPEGSFVKLLLLQVLRLVSCIFHFLISIRTVYTRYTFYSRSILKSGYLEKSSRRLRSS